MRQCVNAFPAPRPGWMRTLGAGMWWGLFTVYFSRFTSSQAPAFRTVGISPLRSPRLGPGFTPVEMTGGSGVDAWMGECVNVEMCQCVPCPSARMDAHSRGRDVGHFHGSLFTVHVFEMPARRIVGISPLRLPDTCRKRIAYFSLYITDKVYYCFGGTSLKFIPT